MSAVSLRKSDSNGANEFVTFCFSPYLGPLLPEINAVTPPIIRSAAPAYAKDPKRLVVATRRFRDAVDLEQSELLQGAECIDLVPVLGHLAVHDGDERDPGDGEFAAGRGKFLEGSLVGAFEDSVRGDLVALDDDSLPG